MRIWFNKTFSTIHAVFRNLHQSVPAGEVTLICTHTYAHAAAFLAADESYLEPAELTDYEYLNGAWRFAESIMFSYFGPAKQRR